VAHLRRWPGLGRLARGGLGLLLAHCSWINPMDGWILGRCNEGPQRRPLSAPQAPGYLAQAPVEAPGLSPWDVVTRGHFPTWQQPWAPVGSSAHIGDSGITKSQGINRSVAGCEAPRGSVPSALRQGSGDSSPSSESPSQHAPPLIASAVA